jgi:hypothetical protein
LEFIRRVQKIGRDADKSILQQVDLIKSLASVEQALAIQQAGANNITDIIKVIRDLEIRSKGKTTKPTPQFMAFHDGSSNPRTNHTGCLESIDLLRTEVDQLKVEVREHKLAQENKPFYWNRGGFQGKGQRGGGGNRGRGRGWNNNQGQASHEQSKPPWTASRGGSRGGGGFRGRGRGFSGGRPQNDNFRRESDAKQSGKGKKPKKSDFWHEPDTVAYFKKQRDDDQGN